MRRLVAPLACLLALPCLTPRAQADEAPVTPPLGMPQVVKDLHWGDVLFHFYQGDHLQALTRLGAAQDFARIGHHALEAELLKGGLYLSLGEHEEAGRIFAALLDGNVPLDVRNRAWFYLAKIRYQRNYLQDAVDALAHLHGALPGDLEPERRLLEAQVLMHLERYDDAVRVLERWQPSGDGADAWSAYARFNIGVAMARKERLDDAARLLGAVGQIEPRDEEQAALRDKANLALGFSWLKADRPALAKPALQRVRLQGSQSNKALLGVGWADAAQERYARALVPWLELRGRNLLDSAVQESYLAVPYAYAKLAADRRAAEHYMQAIQAFDDESRRIDQSIAAIRGGDLLEAIVEGGGDSPGWYWQLQKLPDAPESRYLYHLLATHEFQEGLKNYRDLRLMRRNLAAWSLSIGAFEDMVEARRRAFQQRLPVLQRSLDGVDLDALEERKNALESRLGAIERTQDVAALATAREREQWAKVLRMESVLARADQDDPAVQAMQEKLHLLRGTLMWDFDSGYKARAWRARKELRELDAAYKEARRGRVLVERAREDYPARTEVFAQRVEGLQPRIAALDARLAVAAESMQRHLATVAAKELQAQQQRLAAYALQARFALATLYDRAADVHGAQPGRERDAGGTP